jgi:hypothetical protein
MARYGREVRDNSVPTNTLAVMVKNSEATPTPEFAKTAAGGAAKETNGRSHDMRRPETESLPECAEHVLVNFTRWLARYGETSWDHQSFFSGPLGGRAKELYYRNQILGIAAVAPMIFCEAFLPAARRAFHRRIRFPIADSHYAMGFTFLYQTNNNRAYLDQAVHFLDELEESRCPGFAEYCWGYPFDWVTRRGTITKQTPLITTTPYAYEAFLQVYTIEPKEHWKAILQSISRHVSTDIKDYESSPTASSCSYTPFNEGGVINAAAYRAFLLTSAAGLFADDNYSRIAERNLNFVLENQNEDGSWYYATDQMRDFVDHFHTCFVMKALGKIFALTQHEGCYKALTRGLDYYLKNLFDEDGLPKPFAKAPRLTVYKRELYDCAECVNLCLILRESFPQLEETLRIVIAETIKNWIKPDGSFRSRRLHLGWDNVPMHRWGQSQMFRSLAFYLRETKVGGKQELKNEDPVLLRSVGS